MITKKIAVILFGPPGSGKGTQANLLAEKSSLVQFDTGKFIEHIIYGSKKLDKASLDAKEKFESGALAPSEWITKVLVKKSQELAKMGYGVIFSGSPRTLFEAERLLPEIAKLYGKKNVYVFALKIPAEFTLKRNIARLVCSVCGKPVLMEYYNGKPKVCPICGGKLYRRTLDRPAVIKERIKEYENRTMPVLEFIKKNKFQIVEVDGRPAPYKVFRKIYDHLKNA